MCHCFFFYFVAPIRIWRVLILQWIARAQQSALLVGVWWHLKYLYLHRRQLRSLPRIQSLRGVMNAQPLRSSPPWLRHDMRYPAVMTPPPYVAPREMITPDVNQTYTHVSVLKKDVWIPCCIYLVAVKNAHITELLDVFLLVICWHIVMAGRGFGSWSCSKFWDELSVFWTCIFVLQKVRWACWLSNKEE